jgi:lysozyme
MARRHGPISKRRLSRTGTLLIANFEGFVATPYNDAAGHATIGYGHLIHYGRVTAADRRKWGRISRNRALKLLASDARSAAKVVRGYTKGKMTQGEYDALVSFTFNCGAGAYRSSTLLNKFNRGDHRGAANELLKWNKAGGRTLAGLTRRRRAERARFLKA